MKRLWGPLRWLLGILSVAGLFMLSRWYLLRGDKQRAVTTQADAWERWHRDALERLTAQLAAAEASQWPALDRRVRARRVRLAEGYRRAGLDAAEIAERFRRLPTAGSLPSDR